MAALGDILSIAHVLKRAYALYQGCQSAPEEIYLAREHIHAMALCLEGVRSDIAQNPRSFVHQRTAIAQTKTAGLKSNISACDRALKRMEKLLAKYLGFKSQHVKLWDKFRWSTEGKKEIAECKADLVLSTSVLDLFLSHEGLSVLWKLEGMIEALTRRIGALEMFDRPTGRPRPRSGSNVTRALVISLVLARLRKVLRTYRCKKRRTSSRGAGGKKPTPKPGRPRPVTRVNSGFVNNPNRNALFQTYASNFATGAAISPPPPYSRKPRPRTPSPDFPNIHGDTAPRLTRRSSSMQRLTGTLNARIVRPRPSTERYRCWKVGVGKLAIGLKTAPVVQAHERGQVQLRKMAAVFREADRYDGGALTAGDSRVKLLLEQKNKEEARARSGRKWYFVAARVVRRDPGRTGMVSVEKAFVILVRR